MLKASKSFCLLILLVVFAAMNISAQINVSNIDSEIYQLLLKKDLRQVIKEAETSSANDLHALFRRLILYRRAADSEKYTNTLKQIITNSDFQNSPIRFNGEIVGGLKNPLFEDTAALQTYLQNIGFVDDIYGKFSDSCEKQREKCDISGFDKFLEQQALKAIEPAQYDNDVFGTSQNFTWIRRRIEWREKFGLDNTAIFSGIIEDVRKNSTDLSAALRYLKVLRSVEDINWLVENFTSEQAFDYYDLGSNLYSFTRGSMPTQNDYKEINRIAAQLLERSLSLPFTAEDQRLMWSSRFNFASIPPVVKNHEKQLRFWTKTDLAEAYKNSGEAAKAQPIVEELMNIDTSDIVVHKPSQLAGAVQMASGARAVESKILSEQGARQNWYEYWSERVAYYYGRQEEERMFEAYKQSFAAVPFDLSNERSRESRLYFLREFADFAENKYGYYGNSSNFESFGDHEKGKLVFWIEAENFLRNEFEKTKSNTRYAYELAVTITSNRFKELSDEILSRNPELLVNAAKIDLVNDMNSLLYVFFKSEAIPLESKDLIFDQLLKLSERKTTNEALMLLEAMVTIEEKPVYMTRILPVLIKNLKVAENRFITVKKSDERYSEVEGLKNKYIEVLFRAYLSANDWKSAEKLLFEKHILNSYNVNYSIEQLALNAAKNGAFEDSVRFWKMKANIDRKNLDNLSSLRRYQPVTESLREFYKTMKVEEPFSTVPDLALQILK